MQIALRCKSAIMRCLRYINRVIADRKLMIIAPHRVVHVTISRRVQWAALAVALSLFSWMAFATGTILAYREVMHRSNTRVANLSFHSRELEEQYILERMTKPHAEDILDDGALDISGDGGMDEADSAAAFIAPALQRQASDPVLQRLAFLEKKIVELEDYKKHFLLALQEKTNTRINNLEKAIDLTGLQRSRLERQLAQHQPEALAKENTENGTGSPQGGPFELWQEGLPQDPLETDVMDSVSYLMRLNAIVDRLPLAYPMKGGHITSGYGKRRDPINHAWSMHRGIDFVGPTGTRVFSTADGVVTYAGWKNAYGRMVEVDHPFGISTRYAHLAKILVKPGQEIHRGEVIGVQGSSGRTTGAHLHYEVQQREASINPRKFLKAADYVLQD